MAVQALLKIKEIDGESSTKGFEKCIDVVPWSWGSSQSGSFATGSGGGASGKVSVQDLSFTKYVDAASATLLKGVCTGKHYDEAKLTCRKAGGDNPIDYLVITLTNVMITSISTGGSRGEELLTENVTLAFESFKYVYTGQQSAGGKKGASPEATWNISKNAAS